ncbi:invasion associated locus B family protein [Roseibium alexandrii]|uniref:Invasion protein B, involved in pathogenesis n=1 Tax=Roseibium alexandrii TaxID=388408 RepID=A0A0M6ZR01_9HYPH|nr:invasion associated locus B family protein [Roseibium alexandrii]CTQ64767.1 Invasion protein B, involved in pathogenesis [Roseibium alexandrii]
MRLSLSLTAVLTIVFLQGTPIHAQQAEQGELWQTRCAGTSRSAEALTCEASQSLRVKESGQLLFKVDIIYPGNNAAPVFQMQAPLGFYLPGKVKLTIDGAQIGDMTISTCDQRGCYISAPATDAMIDAMKAGAQLQIDFAASASQRQKIDVPLTGFSRAIAAIQ